MRIETEEIRLTISPGIGEVSLILMRPKDVMAVTTLAHGAGAGMQHSFMETLAIALGEAGIATVRFNFPYMERGKKMPDPPAIAEKTIEVVVDETFRRFADIPVFCSGKSFGGRMSSQFLSKQSEHSIKGMIFYGFPLHSPGKPSVMRAEHLKNITIPMLFLQGTRDTLANIDLVEQVCDDLPSSTLIKIEGGDHSFKSGKQNNLSRIASETIKWIENVLN